MYHSKDSFSKKQHQTSEEVNPGIIVNHHRKNTFINAIAKKVKMSYLWFFILCLKINGACRCRLICQESFQRCPLAKSDNFLPIVLCDLKYDTECSFNGSATMLLLLEAKSSHYSSQMVPAASFFTSTQWNTLF